MARRQFVVHYRSTVKPHERYSNRGYRRSQRYESLFITCSIISLSRGDYNTTTNYDNSERYRFGNINVATKFVSRVRCRSHVKFPIVCPLTFQYCWFPTLSLFSQKKMHSIWCIFQLNCVKSLLKKRTPALWLIFTVTGKVNKTMRECRQRRI